MTKPDEAWAEMPYADLMDPVTHSHAEDLCGLTPAKLDRQIEAGRVAWAYVPSGSGARLFSRAAVLRLVAHGYAPGPHTRAARARYEAKCAAGQQERMNREKQARLAAGGTW